MVLTFSKKAPRNDENVLKKNHLCVMDFNLVTGRQEGVEAHDKFWMSLEETADPGDDARRVDALRLELLHDVQEVVVHLGLVVELKLDLVQQVRYGHHRVSKCVAKLLGKLSIKSRPFLCS